MNTGEKKADVVERIPPVQRESPVQLEKGAPKKCSQIKISVYYFLLLSLKTVPCWLMDPTWKEYFDQ